MVKVRKLTDKEAEVVSQTAYWIGYQAALEQVLEVIGEDEKSKYEEYHKACKQWNEHSIKEDIDANERSAAQHNARELLKMCERESGKEILVRGRNNLRQELRSAIKKLMEEK